MEFFCTRHNLGEVVKILTENKVKIDRTQQLKFTDWTNRSNVKKSMSIISELERRSWALVKVFDPVPKIEKLRKHHNAYKSFLRKKDKPTFVPPLTNPSENIGSIVLKD